MTQEGLVELALLTKIVQSEFQIPQDYSVSQLVPGLMQNLGSADSDLRENSLEVLWTWMIDAKFSDMQMLEIGQQMAANLAMGLGESCSDSVFLRAFSALILGAVIRVDRMRVESNSKPLVPARLMCEWLQFAIKLLKDEKDLRGYVEQKGWAHCLAHTGDLLAEFALHPALAKGDLELILETIALKLTSSDDHVLVHNEDERLAAAVIAILQREIVMLDFYENWLAAFVSPPGGMNWKDAFTHPAWNVARVNSKTFLRSLYFFFVFGFKNDPPFQPVALQKQLEPLVLKTLKQIYPCSRYGV